MTAPGPSHPGKQYVVHLIDSFIVNGPNGQHDVFVTEVVGPSFAVLEEECYDLSTHINRTFPPLLVTRAARQLLVALDYLRSRSVVHGSESITCLPARLPVAKTDTNVDIRYTFRESRSGYPRS